MQSKLVSVIIPNYNSIKFIEETLDCLINQTYKNLEIIVVDDGSTDSSFEFISNLNIANLKLVRNLSKGACAARNYGLRLATGDYIQFLDADDVLDLDKILTQVELLEKDEYKVAVCSTKHFYEKTDQGIITDIPFLYSTEEPAEFLLNLFGADGKNHNMVAQHAWLTPKIVIDQAGFWDESLILDQDGEFFCRVVMASNGICYADNVLCYYRKHRQSGSISSGRSEKHLFSHLASLKSKAEQLATKKETQEYKNAMALQYKILAVGAYPEHKNIYRIAIQKVTQFGADTYEPVLGGAIIETIKSLFGWRTAKFISYWIHRIKP